MIERGRTALLLSPHLDDVAFSCGGIAAGLARAGWRVIVATAFTCSMHPALGFALECQRDKGLADEIDYMALRRDEDRDACAALGAEQVLLDLPEAPNRGYGSAAALFEPPHQDDDVARPLAARLAALLADLRPDLVLAPQGCGRHVDHLRLIEAALDLRTRGLAGAAAFGFYRDTPYVIRDPDAAPDARVAAAGPHDIVVPIDEFARARKHEAVACYASQLGFQFGSRMLAWDALDALSAREAFDAFSARDAFDALSGRDALDAFSGRRAGRHGHAERLRTSDRDAFSFLLA